MQSDLIPFYCYISFGLVLMYATEFVSRKKYQRLVALMRGFSFGSVITLCIFNLFAPRSYFGLFFSAISVVTYLFVITSQRNFQRSEIT